MATDEELWEAVIGGEMQLARARADFFQHASTRRAVLARALISSSPWERGAALRYMDALHDHIPELLDELVGLAMVAGNAVDARRVLLRCKEEVAPAVRELVARRLSVADAEEYWFLAELLRDFREMDALRSLVERARQSDDPEIREVAEDFGQA